MKKLTYDEFLEYLKGFSQEAHDKLTDGREHMATSKSGIDAPHQWICDILFWRDTPEGYDYWLKVSQDIENDWRNRDEQSEPTETEEPQEDKPVTYDQFLEYLKDFDLEAYEKVTDGRKIWGTNELHLIIFWLANLFTWTQQPEGGEYWSDLKTAIFYDQEKTKKRKGKESPLEEGDSIAEYMDDTRGCIGRVPKAIISDCEAPPQEEDFYAILREKKKLHQEAAAAITKYLSVIEKIRVLR